MAKDIIAPAGPAESRLAGEDWRAALVAGTFAALVLAVEHHALWRFQEATQGYRRPVAYIIGTGTLLGAYAAWGLARHRAGSVAAIGLITVVGGLGTIISYLWRWAWDNHDLARYGGGRLDGEGDADDWPVVHRYGDGDG